MNDSTPFTPRPPRRWELFTFTLLVLVAASALLSLVLLVSFLGVYRAVSSDGLSGVSVLVEFALRHGSALDQLYVVLVLAYLPAQIVWQRNTTSMLATFRTDSRVGYHWAIYAWRFVLIGSVVVFIAGGNLVASDDSGSGRSRVLSQVLVYAAGHLLRMVALGILLFGVWQVRDQVRRAVAASGVAPTPRQMGLRRKLTPTAPLLPARRNAPLATADTPSADDAFWARVRALSAEKGADLALLDSTSAWVRRWLLVPAAGPIDAVRAAIPPGNVVTVFPEPVRPAAEAPRQPPTGEPDTEWFGLIEYAGALRFQTLQTTRLPVWLAQARSAERWGLYRADDPGALTAVMPTLPANAGT